MMVPLKCGIFDLRIMISKECDDDDDDNDVEVEENEIGELNLSTRTILRHYANMVRGQRTNTK